MGSRVGRRREKRLVGERVQFRCYGPFHDGEWLDASRFGKKYARKQPRVWNTYCVNCRTYIQVRRRGGNGTVEIQLVRKWLEEVVARSGGINNAARTIGVSTSSMYRWLGRYKGYESQRIHRVKVKMILDTLAGLRDGSVVPPKIGGNGVKVYRYGCRVCGRPVEEKTPGCKTCWNRHRNWDAGRSPRPDP